MGKYEGVFIIKPDLNDESSKSVLDMIQNEIKKNEGKINDIKSWGRKKLAYSIKKFSEGAYYEMDFDVAPLALKEMDKKFRLQDDILRYMILRKAGR